MKHIKRKPGIYKILNTKNGKFYIGSSKNMNVRCRGHRTKLRNNTHGNSHLQSSWNKYKEESFIFSTIEECNEDILEQREQFYINRTNACNNKIGYNKASNVERTSGYKWNKESRKKLSESKKGKKIHPNTLRALTKANKKRKYKKGVKLSKESIEKGLRKKSKPVLQYDLNGDFIKKWDHAFLVLREFNVKRSKVLSCCKDKNGKSLGFQWRYVTENYPLKIKPYKRNAIRKKILAYDLNGNFIKEYDSIIDAKRELNLNNSGSINDCISGKRFSSKNRMWFKKPDNDIFPRKIKPYKRGKMKNNIKYFKSLCSEMSIRKERELLKNPEEDN